MKDKSFVNPLTRIPLTTTTSQINSLPISSSFSFDSTKASAEGNKYYQSLLLWCLMVGWNDRIVLGVLNFHFNPLFSPFLLQLVRDGGRMRRRSARSNKTDCVQIFYLWAKTSRLWLKACLCIILFCGMRNSPCQQNPS